MESPTNLPCVKFFFCLATGHVSEKALYVADTSKRKRKKISSLQARNVEMSGEYETKERILHTSSALLFSPVNDSTSTSQPFFDLLRRLHPFFLSSATPMYLCYNGAVLIFTARSPKSVTSFNRSFSLTWPASMLINWNKREHLHEKTVKLPGDFLGTPTWPPFYCFETPIWPP